MSVNIPAMERGASIPQKKNSVPTVKEKAAEKPMVFFIFFPSFTP